jgi:hypothetical protein
MRRGVGLVLTAATVLVGSSIMSGLKASETQEGRYQIVAGSNTTVFRLDTRTGRMEWCVYHPSGSSGESPFLCHSVPDPKKL